MNKKTLILTLALLAGTALWAQTPEGAPTTDESKDNVEATVTEDAVQIGRASCRERVL